MTGRIASAAFAIGASVSCAAAALAIPVASARPSDPGVVSYAVLGKGSVGNIVGGPMRDESLFTQPFQGYFVDNPVCNNWADIGLPEVYNDPDLASFNGASTQTSPTDQTHFVKQAVGVFATAPPPARRSPGGRPHDRLRRPDHAHAPGQRDDAGVVLRRRAAGPGRRGVEQAGSRNRPPMFHPDPSAGKRRAASESLSVRQWWPGGECAGRCHAERAGAIDTGSPREYVGAVWKMESCDYRWVAARNQRFRDRRSGPEGIGIMAFAVASQLDPARLSDGELASASAAAQHIAETCLADGSVGRVGLEIEAHCYDPTEPHRRPTWDEITEVLESLPAMPGGSVVTVEPGGAVELSGPPEFDAAAAIEAIADDQAVLGKAFAAAGLGLVALGADPLRPAKRINPGARYAAMEQFFTASHTGVAGAAMMTSTASVQVNLDAGPQAGWADRVRLAHALGPVMVAIAANSPLLSGDFTGWRSSRQRVWSQLDSARCGPILTASGEDPGTDWARYALKAPVMLVHSPEAVPVTRRVPFADWADGRELLGGRRPTRYDLEYHLTTLFPPVRPRQVAGDPLPGQRPRRHLAGGGVHAGDPARRPGRRRRWPPKRSNPSPPPGTPPPGSAWATSGSSGRQPVRGHRGRTRTRRARRRDAAPRRRRWRRAAARPTTSPTG